MFGELTEEVISAGKSLEIEVSKYNQNDFRVLLEAINRGFLNSCINSPLWERMITPDTKYDPEAWKKLDFRHGSNPVNTFATLADSE